MNSERKNYPMKEFRAFFPISSILVIRSAYAKKGQFSILAVFQNVGIYINLGCRFEFRMQKLPYERISGNFFDFIDFGHQVWVCKKKDHFSILPVILNIWDLHKFGLQIWIQNAKITLWKNFGQFFDFIDFCHQVWIQNAKITLWKNFGQFFRFHRFWSSGPGMRKKSSFQY